MRYFPSVTTHELSARNLRAGKFNIQKKHALGNRIFLQVAESFALPREAEGKKGAM